MSITKHELGFSSSSPFIGLFIVYGWIGMANGHGEKKKTDGVEIHPVSQTNKNAD